MPGVLPLSPFPVFVDPDQQTVQSNATVTTSGSGTFSGFGVRDLILIINIKNAPTGTLPTITYSIQEVDPGDLTTSIGTSVTGAILSAAGTQILTLPLTLTGVVNVSWVVTGTGSPTFTGVYASLVTKLTTVTSGLDSSGTERALLVDNSGRLDVEIGVALPSGTNTIGAVNQGTATTLSGAWPVEVTTDGTNIGGTATHPFRIDPTGTTTQPVDVTDRAVRLLGVVYGSQGVQIKQTATNDNLQVEVAVGGTLIDPRSIRALTSSDVVTSVQGTAAVSSAPWSVELSDGTSFYTGAKTGQFPSALVGGRLDENVGSWMGSTAPTVGSKTSANSLPVVIASDQGTVAVTASQSTAANLLATVSQGPGSGAAGTYWYVRVTDGTNTMPTMDAAGRAGYQHITDGTNTAAVKAASTAAVATDPALVVAISPNNSVTTTPTPDTTPATQNITAQDVASVTTVVENQQLFITGTPIAGSAVSFALATWMTVLIQVTGTWTGALQVETSMDGGTTWSPRKVQQPGGVLDANSLLDNNFSGSVNVSGYTNIRVRAVAAWTGTATVLLVESRNQGVVHTIPVTGTHVTPAIQTADAFHRLRTSNPVRQWSSMAEYPDFSFLWETAVVSTGTVAWQQFLSSQRLSTGGTGATASATRQSRRYMRYQPGKSLLVLMTFVMSAAKTNSVAEIGYYDVSNGIFFQRNGSTLNVVRRTNATGTPTDNIVAQSSWNVDTLDGTGASGITLDPTKANILVIDIQWLGVGTARIGFDFGGQTGIVWAHNFVNQNALSTVYMSTGCLPVRGRVANTGTAGGTVTLDMICTSVSNEGAEQGRGVLDTDRVSTFSASNGAMLRTVTNSGTPILSIRAATQYGGTGSGGQPNRGWVVPLMVNVYASTVDVYWEVWAGGILTGASFSPFESFSIVDIDVSATSFSTTGGFRVVNGYASATKNSGTGGQFITPYDTPIVYSGLNSTQDTLTLLITSLSTGSNTAGGTVTWEERY